jgi:hypothetical protein
MTANQSPEVVAAETQSSHRQRFIRNALEAEIENMLDELGHPPLVERIFPNGWRTADDDQIGPFFDLCRRSLSAKPSIEQLQAQGVKP